MLTIVSAIRWLLITVSELSSTDQDIPDIDTEGGVSQERDMADVVDIYRENTTDETQSNTVNVFLLKKTQILNRSWRIYDLTISCSWLYSNLCS